MFIFGWLNSMLGIGGGSLAAPKRYFKFDGSNDKIDLANPISLTGDFTIAFWGKITTEGSWSIVGDQTNFANGRIAFNTNTSTLRVDCSGPQTGTFALDESSADGRWHYYILYRSSLGLFLLRDLVEIGDDALAFTGTINVNRIGYRPDDSGFPSWSGGMRELRIYSRAITVAEMNSLIDGKAISGSNLQGYWKMNEVSGSTATDSSGQGRHGIIANHTEATFFASERIPNLWGNKIKNGDFGVLSGDDPGTPWVVTGPTYISVTGGVVTFNTDGTNTRLTQNAIVNFGDTLVASIDITDVTTGSVSIGSDTNNNPPFLFPCMSVGTVTFPFITDRPNFVIRRTGTAACLSSFDNVSLTKVRNYVINGDFRSVKADGSGDPRFWGVSNSGTDYTVGCSAGVCTLTSNVATNAEIYQTVLTIGQTYQASFYITAITGTARIYCGGTLASYTTTGFKTLNFTAASSTFYFTTLTDYPTIPTTSVGVQNMIIRKV